MHNYTILNESIIHHVSIPPPPISLIICRLSCSCLLAIDVGARMCPTLVEPANFCLEWKELLFSECYFVWLSFFGHYLTYAEGNSKIKVIFSNVQCKFCVGFHWATPDIITIKISPIPAKWFGFWTCFWQSWYHLRQKPRVLKTHTFPESLSGTFFALIHASPCYCCKP